MSVTAEEVLTKMTIDDSAYQAGGKRVIAMAGQVVAALKGVQAAATAANSAVGGMGSGNTFNITNNRGGGGGGGGFSLGGGFGFYAALRVARELEHAVVDVGKAFIRFSKDALEAHASMQALRLEMDGIYGSTQKGGQAMDYLFAVSQKSAFMMKDLGQSMKDLAISGLDVNRFLPLAQTLALVKAHSLGEQIGPEGLNEAIALFRRLEGGQETLALGPRGIGRFGIDRNELEAAGGQFDQNGHFMGTVAEGFDVLAKALNKLTPVAQKLVDSDAVKLSNLRDAIYRATTDAGDGVARNVMSGVGTLTDGINELTNQHFFADTVDNIYQALDIPGLINAGGGFKGVIEDAGVELAGLAAHAHEVGDTIGSIIKVFGIIKDAEDYVNPSYWVNRIAGHIVGLDDPSNDPAQAAEKGAAGEAELQRKLDERRKKRVGGRLPTAPSSPSVPGSGNDDLKAVRDLNKEQAEYQRKMVQHMEKMESKVFGSSDAQGISRVDLTSLGGQSKYHQAVALIRAAVQEEVYAGGANANRVAAVGY